MTLPIQEIVLAPGEGNYLTIGNSEVTFKAVGSDTHGHLGVFENLIQLGGTAPGLHIHRHMEQMFYVLEGEVEILVGHQKVQGEPGAFVLVPRATPHAFANRGTKPAKLLIMFTPAGEREKYFEGLAELMKNGQKPVNNSKFAHSKFKMKDIFSWGFKPQLKLRLRIDVGVLDPLIYDKEALLELMRQFDQEPVEIEQA